MAARKKKEINVNLLPQEEFAASTAGRILRWLLSTFRYIVITTEMIVIGAFISRFYFDSRVADLNEEIQQQEDFIRAYLDFEREFKLTKAKLDIFGALSTDANNVTPFVQNITSRLPTDVQLAKLEILSNQQIQIQGASLTESSIGQFVSNILDSNSFEDVSITDIESKANSAFINFTLRVRTTGGTGE